MTGAPYHAQLFFIEMGVLKMFLPRLAWDDQHTIPHPAFFQYHRVSNFFVQAASNRDPPNHLGLQMSATGTWLDFYILKWHVAAIAQFCT
jgi:hypothetical protein